VEVNEGVMGGVAIAVLGVSNKLWEVEYVSCVVKPLKINVSNSFFHVLIMNRQVNLISFKLYKGTVRRLWKLLN
jgi:hypothetical protein